MIERLAKFIESIGISVRAFETSILASNGMIRKAVTNNTDIQSKWLCKIAENYPQLNMNWLLTGNGFMLRNSQLEINSSSTQSNNADIYYNMYKEKDIEVGILKEEIGALKFKINQLEQTVVLNQKEYVQDASIKKHSSQNADNVTSANVHSKK